MHLPETNPRDDPNTLWALQVELMTIAQSVLGPRDTTKRIFQPQFAEDGPHIRNTPSLDGAFTELSLAAGCSWHLTVFQMAHETVHLLNPIPGNTNNLEEGVAVAYSMHVQPSYGISIQIANPSYDHALQLASMLPGGPLKAARHLRDCVGALSEVTAQDLEELFPSVDRDVSIKLAEPFV